MSALSLQALATSERPVIVVGLGATGLSIARFLAARGIAFTVADSRPRPPGLAELQAEGLAADVQLGPWAPEAFQGAGTVILSPGVDPADPALRAAAAAGVPLFGDIELFARFVDAPVVAVTGSNGKSTVTALVEAMAQSAGCDVRVGGNIGTPALALLGSVPPAFYLLELSSFQLEMTRSLAPAAAVVLNVSDDHLDRHGSFEQYAAIKAAIYRNAATMVVNADDARVAAMATPGRSLIRFTLEHPAGAQDFGVTELDGASWLVRGHTPLLPAAELRIPGRHNQANALAALALGSVMGLPMAAMLEALRTFPGLPHRCRWVAEAEGVTWYNDSKGTNVGATVAALGGLPAEKVVLIAGGIGKGADFAPLRRAALDKARAVVLIGRDAALIERALGPDVATCHAGDMQEAVHIARQVARPGDAVLLSPACASFDMFANYLARGEAFEAAVREALS